MKDIDKYLLSLNWRGIHLSWEEYFALVQEVKLLGWDKWKKSGDEKWRMRVNSIKNFESKCLKDWEWIESNDVQWLALGDPLYPKALSLLSFPPLVLTYKGSNSIFERSGLSIVGSRNPCSWSQEWLEGELPVFFEQFQGVILSGGARGIDQLAHSLSIRNGIPTVAFMPSGLGRLYPKNFVHYEKLILEGGGALVSQFSPVQDMFKSHFHKRNEIIAVMSELTFVVEAHQRSGSLLTAHMTLKHGGEIVTLPSIPKPRGCLGNLDLMFAGCPFVRDAQDLLDFWGQQMR